MGNSKQLLVNQRDIEVAVTLAMVMKSGHQLELLGNTVTILTKITEDIQEDVHSLAD